MSIEIITALEYERAKHEKDGNIDLVAQVDEQLDHYRALADAGAARSAAADDGADTTPDRAAGPYDGIAYRDLQKLAKERGVTADGRTHQDLVDALTKADEHQDDGDPSASEPGDAERSGDGQGE